MEKVIKVSELENYIQDYLDYLEQFKPHATREDMVRIHGKQVALKDVQRFIREHDYN